MATKTNDLWVDFENKLLNKQISKRRLKKLRTMYNAASRGLDLMTADRHEIEDFLNQLNRNQFKQQDKTPYSGSTKSDIKKFLKQYYKLMEGDDEFYPKKVSWIRVAISKDEKPLEKAVISQEEAIKLANSFQKPEFRMLSLMLFDSGFRIEEMLSVKKKDLTFEPFDDANKCWWIKCSQSKTEIRTVPIQLFTEEINNLVNTSYYQSLKDDDLIFGNVSYPSYLSSLKLASIKLFGKHLTPHALRHSSATLYASLYEGDMIQLANRYGWSYSSNELKTYIRRSRTFHKIGAKKVFSSELLKLKEENTRIMQRLDHLEQLVKKRLVKEIKEKKGL